jgi:hypothetical protein
MPEIGPTLEFLENRSKLTKEGNIPNINTKLIVLEFILLS